MALVTDLRLRKELIAPDERAVFSFEIENTGDEGIYILKWLTPLEGLVSDCLVVMRDDAPVPYDGRLVKRGTPTIENYVYVGPRETISQQFDLLDAYKVSLPGKYSVRLRTHSPDVFHDRAATAASELIVDPRRPLVPKRMSSRVVTLNVRGSEPPALTSGEKARLQQKASVAMLDDSQSEDDDAGAKAPEFVGGTSDEIDKTRAAHYAGYDLCVDAFNGFANDSRYVEWFGTHTATRFQKAKNVYAKIKAGMETNTLTYDLTRTGCQASWYAYTYHGSSTVWMCGGFWSAPATGTDSKAGIVVHEQSHALANTNDHEYGQSNCRSLAINNPDQAVDNADSFEYYAGG